MQRRDGKRGKESPSERGPWREISGITGLTSLSMDSRRTHQNLVRPPNPKNSLEHRPRYSQKPPPEEHKTSILIPTGKPRCEDY